MRREVERMADQIRPRRGPRPQGPFEGKRRTLTTRITDETRAKLDAAAKASGRSLSQEIELKLSEETRKDDDLGGARVAALFRYLASMIGNRDYAWLDDLDIYNLVVRKWIRHLDAIRPLRAPADQDRLDSEQERKYG